MDESNRGSGSSDSSWRNILEYFEPAYQSEKSQGEIDMILKITQ